MISPPVEGSACCFGLAPPTAPCIGGGGGGGKFGAAGMFACCCGWAGDVVCLVLIPAFCISAGVGRAGITGARLPVCLGLAPPTGPCVGGGATFGRVGTPLCRCGWAGVVVGWVLIPALCISVGVGRGGVSGRLLLPAGLGLAPSLAPPAEPCMGGRGGSWFGRGGIAVGTWSPGSITMSIPYIGLCVT